MFQNNTLLCVLTFSFPLVFLTRPQEITRRILLTGVLIFIPGHAQLVAAIIICVAAVASLHYFQPHRNRIVLGIAQVSFLMTAFKYIVAVLLQIDTSTTTDKEKDQLGLLLVGMDLFFLVACIVSCIAVAVVLRKSLRRGRKAASGGPVKVMQSLPTGRGLPASSFNKVLRPSTSFNRGMINRAVIVNSVNQTKKMHHESIQRKREKIGLRQKDSKDRLSRRLRNRTKQQQKGPKQQQEEGNAQTVASKAEVVAQVIGHLRAKLQSPERLLKVYSKMSKDDVLSKKAFGKLIAHACSDLQLSREMIEFVWLDCHQDSGNESGVDLATMRKWLFVATK